MFVFCVDLIFRREDHPMTNERRPKPQQRYSRFSRSTYDDVLPPPPSEESLAEIAMRALNGHRQPAAERGAPNEAPGGDRGWPQPPPPEPSAFWEELEGPPPADRPQQARNVPPPTAPNGQGQASVAPEAEPKPLPQEAPPPPPQRDPLAERTARTSKAPPPPPADAPAAEAKPEGKRLRRRAAKAEKSGPGALAKAAMAFRTKAAPALAGSALWLAHNLRRREIRKRYNRALVFGHTKILDRKLEKLFFVPTRKSEIVNPDPDRGVHYDGPVPAAVFDWVMKLMPGDLRQFAFIDIRAGRGRTSLLASKANFNRIIAYEYDVGAFDDLQMNVAQYPRSRMVCRNIDCHRGDVDGISLPDQPCVIWFSGAWREQMIGEIMNYVRETYRQSPRRIYVVLENTGNDAALAGDNIFEPVEPPLAERLKLRLLSPMDFKVYRSLV
jgi:hypothetical protein